MMLRRTGKPVILTVNKVERVYFPFDRARRNARIYNEYTGANIPHLAARYHLSEPTV